MKNRLSLLAMSLALVLSGCANNSNGLFQKQIVKPTDLILNCPNEPLVLFPGDPLPKDPTVEYYIIKDQNDAERWNEAVRRAGAKCRAMVLENCQFYKDNKVAVVCKGTKVDE